jgi:hypothetical protein
LKTEEYGIAPTPLESHGAKRNPSSKEPGIIRDIYFSMI